MCIRDSIIHGPTVPLDPATFEETGKIRATGDFTTATRHPYWRGSEPPREVVPGDIDSDGDIDLVVHDAETDEIIVLYNNGDGDFSDPRTETLPLSSMVGTSASHDVEMIIFDANNDGVMDIAVAETRKGAVLVDGSPKGDTWTKVTVYTNTEAGGWAPQKWWEYGGNPSHLLADTAVEDPVSYTHLTLPTKRIV